MKFRTEINPPKSDLQIEYKDSVITFGSCFAENISEYFEFYRFNIMKNPFGVLYNPISVLNALKSLEEEKEFSDALRGANMDLHGIQSMIGVFSF